MSRTFANRLLQLFEKPLDQDSAPRPSGSQAGRPSRRRKPRRKPHGRQSRMAFFEPLEDRLLLAVATWSGLGANSLWTTPANWQSNAAPAAGDSLVFLTGTSSRTT